MSVRNASKKVGIDGVLFPIDSNSDGRPIKFILQCVNGRIYHLLGDHVLKKLRKNSFRRIVIHGETQKKGGDVFVKIRKLVDEFSLV